jgi:tetratricopeptide (TPR) repeat protein
VGVLLAIAVAATVLAPALGQTVNDFNQLNDQCWELKDAGRYAEAERLAERLYRWARGRFAHHPLALGDACNTLGNVYDDQGRYAEAEPLYRQALEVYRKALGEEHAAVAASLNNLAVLYDHQGRYGEAEPLHRQALEIYRKLHGDEHPDVADSLHNLGLLYKAQGRYTEAESLHKEALETQRKALGDQHPDVAKSLNSLAGLYRVQGRYAEAEPLHKQSLEIKRKALGAEHPSVAASLHNLALLYDDQALYEEAEQSYKQALEIQREVHGDQHPDVALSLYNLAVSYRCQGRYAEAEALHKRALAIRLTVYGDEHPDVADSLNALGVLYYYQSRRAEAEPFYQQALNMYRKVLGAEHPFVAMSLHNLALVYNHRGRNAEAEPLFQEALEIRRKVFGDQHPDVAASLEDVAALYCELGRNAEAESLYRQVLRIRREVFGDQHPDVAQTLNNLASFYKDRDRYAEAEPLLEEAQRIARRGLCDPQGVARVHWNQAEVYWQTDRKAEAAAALEEALRALEQQRVEVSGGELEGAWFFGRWTHLFELMVSWQCELQHPAEAFRAMERSRARALLDQIQTAGLDLLAGLPGEEARRLRQQKSQAAGRVAAARKQLDVLRTRQDLSPDQKEKEHERLLAELREAQFEYTWAYADLRNASPAYRLAISDEQKPVSAEKLQQWVNGHQALVLEYLLGTKAGYVFVLPVGEEPQVLKLELTAEQAVALGVEAGPLTAQRMRAILSREDETGVLDHLRASHDPRREQKAAASLAALWNLLVPEAQRGALVEGEYGRLVVLPDASLAPLPFETLVVEPGDELKYLLDVGPPIVYAPSATILLNLAEREAQVSHPAAQPVLAVGDCVYGKPAEASGDTLLAQLSPQARYRGLRGRHDRLKYSAWEISFVAEVFGKRGIKVAWLKGPQATERNVRHNARGRRILDLACHGRVDQAYGNLFGALALTPGSDLADAANDGLLTLAETYGLDLKGCELAILSACETNVGPEQRGEGVWALSRGFLAAGARRVVATNWLLDDEAAASTVSYFCAGVARQEASEGDVDYARALHEAKRWVRSVDKWSSPYYWAPMVLIGPE